MPDFHRNRAWYSNKSSEGRSFVTAYRSFVSSCSEYDTSFKFNILIKIDLAHLNLLFFTIVSILWHGWFWLLYEQFLVHVRITLVWLHIIADNLCLLAQNWRKTGNSYWFLLLHSTNWTLCLDQISSSSYFDS